MIVILNINLLYFECDIQWLSILASIVNIILDAGYMFFFLILIIIAKLEFLYPKQFNKFKQVLKTKFPKVFGKITVELNQSMHVFHNWRKVRYYVADLIADRR